MLRRFVLDRRARRRFLAAMVAVAAVGSVAPVFAAGAKFDAPRSQKTVPGSEGRETICTGYGDVTVVEWRDGPAAEAPRLVSGAVDCATVAAEAGTAIEVEGMALEGRIGPLLLFTALDPNGAIDFVVAKARDGEVVMKEALIDSPSFTAARVGSDGTVTLAYRRAINASCSLYQNAGRCWETLLEAGVIPGVMARRGPAESVCARSYRAEKSPRDNPSIVTWDQETIIAADGAITKSFSDKVGCRPLP